MSFALCSALLAACFAGALATRVTVKDSEELPWKKGALVGALIGQGLSGSAVASSLEKEVDFADASSAGPKTDAFDRLETLLVDFLGGHESSVEPAVEKLVENLRLSESTEEDGFVGNLEGSIRAAAAHARRLGALALMADRQDDFFREIVVPFKDGSQNIIIERFHVNDHRSQEDLGFLKLLLWCMARSTALGDIFLHPLAQSHIPDELAADPDAEVLVVLEPHIATLHDFLLLHEPRFESVVRLFVQAYRAVQQLFVTQIPHRSDITLENVYVKGDLAQPVSLRLVLSPLILSADRSSRLLSDSYFEDLMQLGTLLRSMLNRKWPTSTKARAEALRAFGKAMECGALEDGGTSEFEELMEDLLSDETSVDKLFAWRIGFLRRALAIGKGEAGEPKEIEMPVA